MNDWAQFCESPAADFVVAFHGVSDKDIRDLDTEYGRTQFQVRHTAHPS